MQRRPALPPGPAHEHWLMGSLPRLARDPLKFFYKTSQLGEISTFRLLGKRCYFLNQPDLIKQVLQAPEGRYGKESIDFQVFRSVLGNGLLTSQGDFWLRQRRLMQPAFHHAQVEAFAPLMVSAIQDTLDSWKIQEPFDIWLVMRQLAMRVAGKALIGTDLNTSEIGKHMEVLENYIVELFQFPLLFPTWIPTPANRHLKQAHKALYRQIDQIIAQRKTQHVAPPGDVLSLLLTARDEDGKGMSRSLLHDEVLTLLFNGHETAAATLSWIFYMLAKYPEIEKRLHQELDAVLAGRCPVAGDVPALSYTKMLIMEALRLWPPAFFSDRSVGKDGCTLGGYPLRKGSLVFFSSYVMHRHPDFWERPNYCNPERFSPEQEKKRPRYAYFPFGGGPHKCIGEGFALLEITLAVAMIAQRYTLRFLDTQPIESDLRPALRPKNLRMTMHARNL